MRLSFSIFGISPREEYNILSVMVAGGSSYEIQEEMAQRRMMHGGVVLATTNTVVADSVEGHTISDCGHYIPEERPEDIIIYIHQEVDGEGRPEMSLDRRAAFKAAVRSCGCSEQS
jgi:hypothetical protein